MARTAGEYAHKVHRGSASGRPRRKAADQTAGPRFGRGVAAGDVAHTALRRTGGGPVRAPGRAPPTANRSPMTHSAPRRWPSKPPRSPRSGPARPRFAAGIVGVGWVADQRGPFQVGALAGQEATHRDEKLEGNHPYDPENQATPAQQVARRVADRMEKYIWAARVHPILLVVALAAAGTSPGVTGGTTWEVWVSCRRCRRGPPGDGRT